MEHLKDVLDDVHVTEHQGPVLLGDLASVHVHSHTVLLYKGAEAAFAHGILASESALRRRVVSGLARVRERSPIGKRVPGRR